MDIVSSYVLFIRKIQQKCFCNFVVEYANSFYTVLNIIFISFSRLCERYKWCEYNLYFLGSNKVYIAKCCTYIGFTLLLRHCTLRDQTINAHKGYHVQNQVRDGILTHETVAKTEVPANPVNKRNLDQAHSLRHQPFRHYLQNHIPKFSF